MLLRTTTPKRMFSLHRALHPSITSMPHLCKQFKGLLTPTQSTLFSTTTSAASATSMSDNPSHQGTPHFRRTPTTKPLSGSKENVWENPIGHPIWTEEELSVKATHVEPNDLADKVAFMGVKTVRFLFDIFSGYSFGPINEGKLLKRILFLETVAGIPGMVAGSLRHLRSLRKVQRDHGWIHTLLEEAENERMHMLVFQQIKKPGIIFQSLIAIAQGIFWNVFFFSYMLSPRLCHRFVGYLEEEAVHTYTVAIEAVDQGLVPWTKEPALPIAIDYWKLAPDATMRDVLLAVRADEAHHRDVNHTFSTIDMDDDNPFVGFDHRNDK